MAKEIKEFMVTKCEPGCPCVLQTYYDEHSCGIHYYENEKDELRLYLDEIPKDCPLRKNDYLIKLKD
jgi:hypothetical protein